MALFAQTDIVLPIATAVIAALATTLAAVLPVWLRLRHERITREIETQKSQTQQGVLESDVDQLENQLVSAQSRVKGLEARVSQLESDLSASQRLVGELRQQLVQASQIRAPVQERDGSPPPVPGVPPVRPMIQPVRAGTGSQLGRDKRAYLVGAQPRGPSVQWLVKVHDYRGKAIYVYDLLTGEWGKEADATTGDIDDRIVRYGQVGLEIDHPGNIRLDNAVEWIAHAKRAAQKLGLRIETQPSSCAS